MEQAFPPLLYVGIDVGGRAVHGVAIDAARRAVATAAFAAGDLGSVLAWTAPAAVVAVDAPAQLSTAPHATDTALAPKFRVARCAEVALGRDHRVWVPWVAPLERPDDGWMAVGLRLFESLRAAGRRAIEVFPYAGFRALNAWRPLPKKTTKAGARARMALLRAAGVESPVGSHHVVDALLAALVARDHASGAAEPVTCGHDGSVIWLPAR